MTHYLRNGNSFRVSEDGKLDVYTELPVGNYIISQDQHGNFYFDRTADFEMPGKIYGNTLRHADRILRTFADRPATTGVMLNGEKGSGKTLLAKMLSIKGAEQGIPTILINRPWHGDAFNKLVQDVQQPAIFLFDEFEKVYDSDTQEAILTLFDGVFPTKKLFVLTCNDKWRVDKHMRNRLGRIYYMLDFKGLGADFIEEYCREKLNNQDHVESVMRLGAVFAEFNFDMLKAVVEEMNRYCETAQEVMAMLNTKPEYSEHVRYDVEVIVDGVPVTKDNISPNNWRGNPLMDGVQIDVFEPTGEKTADGDDDEGEWSSVTVRPSDIKKIDSQGHRFVFVNERGSVILTRQPEKTFDYGMF